MAIDAMDLGAGGVNVDSDPLDLPDNQLQQAQNATHSGLSARTKALIKRPGLARIHAVSFGAPILGGIEVPNKGTASAPTQGGGISIPGSAGSMGNPAGGTGSTVGGNTINSTGTSFSGNGVGSGKLFGGKRLIAIARSDNTHTTGVGWWLTSEGFADVAIPVSASGIPYTEQSHRTLLAGFMAQPGSAVANGVLYYSAFASGLGSNATLPALPTKPVVRRNDGTSDTLFATVPPNPQLQTHTSARYQYYINSMQTAYGDGNTIYLTVYDRIDSGGIYADSDNGRILALNVTNGQFTEMFNNLASDSGSTFNMPFVVNSFLNRPWFGTITLATGGTPAWAMLTPQTGSYDGQTVKNVGTLSTTGAVNIVSMAQFSGSLFFGTSQQTTATGAVGFALIYQISADNSTGPAVVLTGSGGSTGVTKNAFVSLMPFNGYLYASYFNPTQASKIYRSADGITWSVVFASTGGTTFTPLNLFKDPDTDNPTHLYAVGSTGAGFLSTTDGATGTWNDQSSNFPRPNSDLPINMMFGFDQ